VSRPKATIEQLLEGRAVRRGKAEDRFLTRLDKRTSEAAPLIGELCREGLSVFYINILSKDGRMTGKTREFPTDVAATDFLLRNNYV
jgi:hypothetical protein